MVPHYEPGEKVELLIPPSYTLQLNKLMTWKEKWFHHTHYFQVLKTFIKQSNVVHFEILLIFLF